MASKESDSSNVTAHSVQDLFERGLMVVEGKGFAGALTYERPAWLEDPLWMRDCSVGAFTHLNSRATQSMYRCHFGRYCMISEGTLLGAPEHPNDWFSGHQFAFTRPEHVPKMYHFDDFARLAPDGSESYKYTDTVANDTYFGHEVYIGAKSFVRRGVTVGDGAIIGAGSVVTRDVPPYAIVVGAPARVQRLRFSEYLVERFMKLQWWRYDLAPFKHQVNFSKVEETLEFFEQRLAEGELKPIVPATYRVKFRGGEFEIEQLDAPIYFPESGSRATASSG